MSRREARCTVTFICSALAVTPAAYGCSNRGPVQVVMLSVMQGVPPHAAKRAPLPPRLQHVWPAAGSQTTSAAGCIATCAGSAAAAAPVGGTRGPSTRRPKPAPLRRHQGPWMGRKRAVTALRGIAQMQRRAHLLKVGQLDGNGGRQES